MSVVDYDSTKDLRHRDTVAARDCADWLAFLEVEGKAARTLDEMDKRTAQDTA